ncbi:glycosyltransferase family 4 protein [Marinobacter sp.]|uniref:glycosyltransferase family 4 protein n=1 Tax=Marinobacter sp. TaxID=50741 RepID=UPI003A8ED5BF
MRRLNILQFITPAGFYGAERWVLALANNIDRSSVTCDLAVTRESKQQDLTVAEVYPQSVGEVHYLDMAGRFDLRAINQLVDVIRSRQIDVIHTHGYKSDILGLLAAKKAGIRCVSTPHGFSGKVGFKLGAFIKLGTFMLRYFDAVVPLSEELMGDMKRFGVPESKTRFIRNGVDLIEIDAATQELGPRDTQLVYKNIGYIGQMIPRKGLADLLTAFDSLYATDQAVRLQMLGDGRQRSELEVQAASLKSAGAIEFLGFRSDRLALLAQFDLFVMTSSLEGIPRCLMEAMAVGVPVVAYDIPGVDQLVKHGETGLLAPLGDVNALVDCCNQALTNPELARHLVANARALIDKRFSAARMAREYEALFAQLVSPDQPESSPKNEAS